ncbi:S8 family serine peptidase [Endozoicomonadaceae bacterium StTr2]
MKPALITLALLSASVPVAATESLQQKPASGRVVVSYHSEPTPARAIQFIKTGATYKGAAFNSSSDSSKFNFDVVSSGNVTSLQDEEALAALVANDPQVAFAEPDYQMQILGTSTPPALSGTPNDGYYSQQWYLYEKFGINAPDMWSQMDQTGTVDVAVVDSGVLTGHPDLVGVYGGGLDVISSPEKSRDGNGRDNDPSDPGTWETAGQCGTTEYGEPVPPVNIDSSWHGTHVATTIAAETNNNQGMVGVIHNQARITAIRAIGPCGGFSSEIAAAILLAVGFPLDGFPAPAGVSKVINLSLGGYSPECPELFRLVIAEANARGAIIVAAAGNNGDRSEFITPGNCPGVITVAATNRAGEKAYYSSFGSNVDIAAPGGETKTLTLPVDLSNSAADQSTALTILPYTNDPIQLTSTPENGILAAFDDGTQGPQSYSYAYLQGTSMATPMVSGVIAALSLLLPDLTYDQARNIIQYSAQPFPQGGLLSCIPELCGAGILDAGAAYRRAKEIAAGL